MSWWQHKIRSNKVGSSYFFSRSRKSARLSVESAGGNYAAQVPTDAVSAGSIKALIRNQAVNGFSPVGTAAPIRCLSEESGSVFSQSHSVVCSEIRTRFLGTRLKVSARPAAPSLMLKTRTRTHAVDPCSLGRLGTNTGHGTVHEQALITGC